MDRVVVWACFVLTAAMFAPAVPQDAKKERKEVPDEAAQKDREALIRGIFKAEYAKTSAADKLLLSRKLLQQASQSGDDPVARFVLLREARNLAAESGDVETLFLAIDQMAATYEVSPGDMKTSGLATAIKSARTPDDFKKLSAAYITLADESLAVDGFEAASLAAAQAVSTAKRAKDVPLTGKAEAKSKEAADAKVRFNAAKRATEKLASAPDDPQANLAVGQFLCLVKGDWEAGLAHLEKGSDSRLKELAFRDRSKPAGTADQLALADGWWDLAERERGRTREALRRRAALWYGQAAPHLSGLLQSKAQQRLVAATPAWAAEGLFGHWRLDDGSGTVAADSSAQKRNGKVEGATWVKGQIGGALSFVGQEHRVSLNAGDLAPPWTVALWVRKEEASNGTMRLTDSIGYPNGSSLRLQQASARVGITKYTVIDHAFNYTAPAGTWVHLAFVGTERSVALYANGAWADALGQAVSLSVDRLGSGSREQSLKASLDDVRVYTRALPGKEIEMLHDLGKR